MQIDLTFLPLFLGAALLLNISPGPDLIYVVSNSVANGRRVGFAAAFGISVGALVHVSAAAIGLSAIIATSWVAFSIVKYAGAAYLIVLGIRAVFRANLASLTAPRARMSAFSAFRQGVVVDVLNPKPAIFFMAFLPQFAQPALGQVPLQLATLGAIVVLIGLCVELVAAMLSSQLTTTLRKRPSIGAWLDRFLGTTLVALGLRLAFERSPGITVTLY